MSDFIPKHLFQSQFVIDGESEMSQIYQHTLALI